MGTGEARVGAQYAVQKSRQRLSGFFGILFHSPVEIGMRSNIYELVCRRRSLLCARALLTDGGAVASNQTVEKVAGE